MPPVRRRDEPHSLRTHRSVYYGGVDSMSGIGAGPPGSNRQAPLGILLFLLTAMAGCRDIAGYKGGYAAPHLARAARSRASRQEAGPASRDARWRRRGR